MTSPLPSLPELDSESHRSFREALQGEIVLVPSDVSSHLDSDSSHRTTSQNSPNQSWSMAPDVLSREMGENVQNVRALESVHPVNHQEPNVQRQLSEHSIPERQVSNQTRERTIESADEPPTQRPRLENPASWSRVDDPGHCFPATTVEDEEDMWTETDPKVFRQQQVDDHIWKNNGSPFVCVRKSGMSAIPVTTSRHMCVSVDLNSLA